VNTARASSFIWKVFYHIIEKWILYTFFFQVVVEERFSYRVDIGQKYIEFTILNTILYKMKHLHCESHNGTLPIFCSNVLCVYKCYYSIEHDVSSIVLIKFYVM